MTTLPGQRVPLAANARKAFKQQRVDRLTDLRLDDPTVHRDAQILEMIKNLYRWKRMRRGRTDDLAILPTLYCLYRGTGFPLKRWAAFQKTTPYAERRGRRLPEWRSLSSWMKVQISTMVLAEPGYMTFKVHLHDELADEIAAGGGDQKIYLRNAITRVSRKQYGRPSWFFFVLEDLTADGAPTRPHAHGSIEVQRQALPTAGEKLHRKFARLANRKGQEHAELIYSQLLTKELLRVASGNQRGDRSRESGGVNQARNVWTSTPRRSFFNDQWVTYAFKNIKSVDSTLGESRLVISQALRTEASRLWLLIKRGEPAIEQWL